MRSCGGSWTRRSCRRCWRGRRRPPLLELCHGEAAVICVQPPDARPRVVAAAGCDAERGSGLAGDAALPHGRPPRRTSRWSRSGTIATARGSRSCPAPRPLGAATAAAAAHASRAVLRQGFDLCSARERPVEAAGGTAERQLEPLLPGFVCASAAMQRVTDQIQRLQGNDLTVLVTGESGTGKDLVARAIHAGSSRQAQMFLPYNCTSATRELADSQLFGHRRGSFTGAVADQPGVLRTAVGGTLFLDEVGDLPLDVQPKLLRFLEQGEVLPVGDTRPAARGRPGRRRHQRRSRAARGRRQVPRGSVLSPQRDPHPRAAAARAARGDPAPEHVLPARGLRAHGQAGRAPEPGHARSLRQLRLAGQRPSAAQRGAARRGDGLRRRRHHARSAVGRIRRRRATGWMRRPGPAPGGPRSRPRSRSWSAR